MELGGHFTGVAWRLRWWDAPCPHRSRWMMQESAHTWEAWRLSSLHSRLLSGGPAQAHWIFDRWWHADIRACRRAQGQGNVDRWHADSRSVHWNFDRARHAHCRPPRQRRRHKHARAQLLGVDRRRVEHGGWHGLWHTTGRAGLCDLAVAQWPLSWREWLSKQS